MQWLVVSVVLSVVLTVVVNVALRAFPQAGARVGHRIAELSASRWGDPARADDRTRAYVPWKAMIIGSVILTVLVNALRWIT